MSETSATSRRNRKGCQSSSFYRWADEPFEEMDSTIAVQQFIQQTIRKDPSNIEEILQAPDGQEEGGWKYEHLRQFCLQLNRLAVKLQTECSPQTCTQMTATEQWIFLCAAHKTPKECPAIDYTRHTLDGAACLWSGGGRLETECSPQTCTQMTATEQWIFLCAAHKTPKECPAIDYTRHTLDGAACLLNSNKYFPSRVTIKESSVAKLGSVCRRVYRIFSHAFFHHKTLFDEFENEMFLCKRFTAFVIKYNLMSKDNLIVPIVGLDTSVTTAAAESDA
ncbi:unnamed protein product [Oppiella nova]|uniref:Uncharacterized protein n=1 Tax=Oppiella nova TaxID=334625 RepID=A0A7R9LU74_9ACAR|nr:unnamed protein product [Oppiella nova]CAG2167001.1 unnamed protein product [Oppiella nova]